MSAGIGLRVAVLACLLACAAHAQDRPALRAGARVRFAVWTPAGRQTVVGSLLFLDRDTLTVVRHLGEPESFPLRRISYLELNRGKPKMLTLGLPVWGAALGAWIGIAAFDEDPACGLSGYDDPSCGWETPAAVVGAASGVVVALLAVRYLVPEAWQDIPMERLLIAGGSDAAPAVQVGMRLGR